MQPGVIAAIERLEGRELAAHRPGRSGPRPRPRCFAGDPAAAHVRSASVRNMASSPFEVNSFPRRKGSIQRIAGLRRRFRASARPGFRGRSGSATRRSRPAPAPPARRSRARARGCSCRSGIRRMPADVGHQPGELVRSRCGAGRIPGSPANRSGRSAARARSSTSASPWSCAGRVLRAWEISPTWALASATSRLTRVLLPAPLGPSTSVARPASSGASCSRAGPAAPSSRRRRAPRCRSPGRARAAPRPPARTAGPAC